MIIETLQRKLQRTATVYGALAAFAFAGMGHVATAQTAKSAKGAVAAPATVDATLAAYPQVPLSQVSAESMGAKAKAAKAKPVAAEEEESASPSKPGSEGIKVHGHWVLQVKNADGTLGERREFENSLTTVGTEISGDQVIGLLLSGNASAGDPAVIFSNNTTSTDPTVECFTPSFIAGTPACGMLTTTESLLHNDHSFFTTVDTPSVDQTGLSLSITLNPVVQWVMSGTYQVVAGQTQIGSVETAIGFCVAAGANGITTGGGPNPDALYGTYSDRAVKVSSSGCGLSAAAAGSIATTSTALQFGTLTFQIIPNGPLLVTPGQLVQVKVTISFS